MSQTQNITEHRQHLWTHRQSATKMPTTTETQLKDHQDTSRRTNTINHQDRHNQFPKGPAKGFCFPKMLLLAYFVIISCFPSPSSRHRQYRHPPSSKHRRHHRHHHHVFLHLHHQHHHHHHHHQHHFLLFHHQHFLFFMNHARIIIITIIISSSHHHHHNHLLLPHFNTSTT